jgi:ElaB/YqjD/DUF883 family membrane-anchored ribosome-binding protein
MNESMPPSETIGTPVERSESESATTRAKEAIATGKEEIQKVGGRVFDQAMRKSDRFRQETVHKLNGLASNLERTAGAPEGEQGFEDLARYGAQALRKISGMIEGRSTEELLDEVRTQIEEHPTVVIGIAAALGFIGARLLRR